MNTVGKVLVILNFFFAMFVGAFLVVDFVARANWKTLYDDQSKKIAVISADREQHVEDASKLYGQVTDQKKEIDGLKDTLAETENRHKAELSGFELKLEEAKNEAKASSLTLNKALSDIERLKVSEGDLKKIIKDREQSILALQVEVKKYRTEAIAKDQFAAQVQERNVELLDQISKLTLAFERYKGLGSGGQGPAIRFGNQPNPPSTMVKGKIERVNKDDGTLVQISLGTDQGVNKGNTMEVFRTAPAAKYLGMVRILDAEPTRSVGRLIVPPGATRPRLVEGDQVWSRLK